VSKADQLGSGRFGGGVRTVSARRQALEGTGRRANQPVMTP
jgi:ParB family chromosome partitioning protein